MSKLDDVLSKLVMLSKLLKRITDSHAARTKFLGGQTKFWGGNGFAMISKKKIFTVWRADFGLKFQLNLKLV